ncbi:MAG: LTA synthase family protein [Alphaproteobacteria bacterium]
MPSAASPQPPSRYALGRFAIVIPMSAVFLATFAALRLVLLTFAWPSIDHDAGALLRLFAVGLVYDLAFLAYVLIPISLYLLLLPERLWHSRANRYLVHAVAALSILALGFGTIAEILFWNEFETRFNFIAVDYLIYRREVTENVLESYPVAALVAALVVATALVYWRVRPRLDAALAAPDRRPKRLALGLACLALPTLAFLLVGQTLRSSIPNNYQEEVASNGPYQLVAAFRNNELDFFQLYATLGEQRLGPILKSALAEPAASFRSDQPYDIHRWISHPGPPEHLNVVLIMVESLGTDFLGIYGNPHHLTPRLDQLAGDSLRFDRFFATGTRTVRGLEAVTLSIPPTPGQSIVKRLGRESGFWSLGNLLDQQGYASSFIYGGRGYFDNMNAFFAGNGYHVVDYSAAPTDKIHFANAWGMADEDLYSLALEQADRAAASNKPFFFHIMTTSNHRPYTYPDDRIDIPSGSGRRGAVKYTDWAIGDFLDRAKDKPWFDDTVFVILGDHTAGSAGKSDLPVERYRIPLLIYSPKHVTPGRIETVSSQIDVAPTLLALLGMSYESAFFGKDILAMAEGDGRALIGTYQALGLYEAGKLAILRPQRQMLQQADPEKGDEAPPAVPSSEDDPEIERAIAFYQAAANIYAHRLNAWPEQDPAPSTPPVALHDQRRE